jgi:hypothetical protein
LIFIFNYIYLIEKKGALKDLDQAIDLAIKYEDFKVLSLALTQKGTILRLNGLKFFFITK